MLEYNEITPRKYIIHEGQPYEVIDSHVFRMQQRKPQNKTKLKNLLSGKVVEVTYHQAEKVHEAEIEEQEIKYLYNSRGEWWFCDSVDASKRFKISEEILGMKAKFLKTNAIVDAELFEEKIFDIKMPATVDLKVTEAPPSVKGDTAKGGNKLATVETGAQISVPLFVAEGDVIRINTETGEYRERV